MPDRFRAKTWILAARLLLCLPLALFAIIFGLLFWTGAMTDANNLPRPAAGPPMLCVGLFLLAAALLNLAQLVAHRTPAIRCFRNGIECNLVGATSLDTVPLPSAVRLAWSIVSLQGFRAIRRRIPWTEFRGAEVAGLPMALRLRLHAPTPVVFRQHTLKTHPNEIAQALNHFAASPRDRDQLPIWP